jgi:hypothetical protein
MAETGGDEMGSAFIKLEDKFEQRFGSATKLSCCGKEIELRLGCQIIAVLVVLDAIMKFGTTFARWGAPCFHWESYAATVLTFVSAHIVRCVGLGVGVWVVLSLRGGKNVEKATGVLFQYLVALAAVCILDLFVCLFEVHDVCHSAEIDSFNHCAHTWGIQAHVCEAKTAVVNDQGFCATVNGNLKRDDAGVDKVACESAVDADSASPCTYKAKPAAEYQFPDCCKDPMWDGKFSPCGTPLGKRPPAERPATFDSTWCEEISDLCKLHPCSSLSSPLRPPRQREVFHKCSCMQLADDRLVLTACPTWYGADDVGLGLVCTAIVIGMAYVVHSFRVEAKD